MPRPSRRPFPALAAALALTLAGGGASGALAQTAAAPGDAAAAAPAVTDQGAAAMTAALAAGMERLLADQEGVQSYDWDGEPAVTPAGDHYEVTLPPITAAFADGGRADLGAVRLQVRPLGDGRYGFAATLPSSIALAADDGAPTGSITIGRQTVTGVWLAAHDTTVSFDAALADVTMVAPDSGERHTIGSVTMMEDLQPDGPATWSGPIALALSDVSVTPGEAGAPASRFDGLTAEVTVSRLDLEKANRFGDLAKAAAAGDASPAGLVGSLRTVLDGATFRLRFTGLAGIEPATGQTVRLDQLAVSGGVEGVDAERGSAKLGFEARGLHLEPAAAPPAFMPDRFDVDLTLADVPSRALWQALAGAAEDAGAPGGRKAGGRKDAMDDLGDRLVAVLAQAGTALRIERLQLNTPALGARTTGTARVAADSAFGAVADLTVELRGLDAAAEALRPAPGRQPDEETQETLGMIAMLQAMGQQAKDEAGTDVRTYRIEATEAGALLLNGADMSALFAAPAPEPMVKRKE
ncbi:hypothetical protein [Azospirillum sp. ST 5-10]|uniref:hypothetical protein n=1 Tax=unclassified Azospirillum TaxID=2630922 RepID=UPI003F4A4376